MTEPDLQDARPRVVGFLLVEGFPLMSFAAAVEPLRAANVLSGRQLYEWRFVGPPGREAVASNLARLRLDHAVGDAVEMDALFVCAGGNPALYRDAATLAWLKRLGRRRVLLGGISGGSYLLARAGLLDRHRCTIHWEHAAAFREDFPRIDARATLFEMDRDRVTCAGGIASLDMMLAIIEADHGAALARAVTEWFVQSAARPGGEAQRMSPRERLGIRDERLLAALRHIERRFDEPVAADRLAAIAGLSARHLRRLFAAELGTTPERYVLSLRLDRARELIRQSSLSILAVAVASGFVSASHFSRAYKGRFGVSPRAERATA